MGQSRRTNTPDEFTGWARFTSAATRCHAADKRDELAPSQHCMSASDASAAG
jgi:hypothetical protein